MCQLYCLQFPVDLTFFFLNYILLVLVFTRNSSSKLYKVRINSSVLQGMMKCMRKLQLILCAVHLTFLF